jgi:hypothetical protein
VSVRQSQECLFEMITSSNFDKCFSFKNFVGSKEIPRCNLSTIRERFGRFKICDRRRNLAVSKSCSLYSRKCTNWKSLFFNHASLVPLSFLPGFNCHAILHAWPALIVSDFMRPNSRKPDISSIILSNAIGSHTETRPLKTLGKIC